MLHTLLAVKELRSMVIFSTATACTPPAPVRALLLCTRTLVSVTLGDTVMCSAPPACTALQR